MIALTLFVSVAMALTALLVADVGRSLADRERLRTLEDVAVVSSVKLRVEALETIAARWRLFGSLLGPVISDGHVNLPASSWSSFEKSAADLKKAQSGYQGRTTAVLKVVIEANGFYRDRVTIMDDAGSKLGIEARPLVVHDEAGHTRTIDGGWYARKWTGAEKTASTISSAVLRWDVSPGGEGGYPGSWAEAVNAGRLDPVRSAVFRAELGGGS